MSSTAKKLVDLFGSADASSSTYNGTVVQDGGSYKVMLDGATEPTECATEVKASVGDRVAVEIKNHMATIKGNVSKPATDDTVANEALEKVNTLEVDALKADSAVIRDLQADTAKVHSLTADQLSAATAYVGELTAGEVTAQSIIADKAKLAQVDTDQLNADHAVIESLDATYASIGSLNAATARIGDIEADYLKTADMEAEQARVGQLVAGKADVADLTAANARIDNLESTKADISYLEAQYITADAIDTTYLHADMSNADVAWIQNGTIKDGSISNAMINSLSANKLTAGTINGETINVTNINADNITAGTINGQRIGEGSLSLDKLSEDVYTEKEVDDKLSAMQAEIDGAIETWTGTAVPTLNNSPASDWKTSDERDRHVGDVYFVVNSQSQQNGYNYRFTKSGNTYSWQLIKDSDVTNALQRLSTAEGKITTFDSDISKLKTDTGTLTTKTESLETRMSDAEDDILDKVDTTTFNEVSDTVDQHSQSITQMSQTLSNKADGSTVTALTNRVSKTEQDISGINTTIGTLQTTVESKADGSTVEGVSNRLNTVSETVDGHTQSITSINSTLETKADSSTVSSLTTKVNTVSDTVEGHTQTIGSVQSAQTTMQGKLDKTVVETTQLWYSKAGTDAPAKPTSQVTSTSTNGNAWRVVVPAYNSSYPNYFYCWQWKYTDGTYGWSSVTRDIATGESQERARTAITNAAAADTKAGNAATAAATAQSTAEGAASDASKAKTDAAAAVSTANTAASDASTALSTANTANTNADTAISTANTAASDASTAKTNAATAVSTANTAKATADKNVKSSLQLWFTKANETAPNKPTSKVTSTAVSGNGWRTVVPTYSSTYPYYFYCMQYELADGTYTWSDVVYDRATTENQSNSRSAVSGVSTLTTKTNEISTTVDGHTSKLNSITETQTTIQGSAVKSTVQLWFTKANTTAPSKPTAHVTTNDASKGNQWNLAVPTYNSSYPYYYYCYEHQLLNDTYTWSAVTRDMATEESQSTSRSAASAAAAADTKAGNAASAAAAADTKATNAATAAATADGKAVSAQNTANKNVKESQQLWYTKANSTAPSKPTSKVTSTATSGGAWTTRVPTYSDSYKHYFYCMQYIAADGTVTWSDVIYDQATTEAQSVARAASADLTEFHQEYATFKQTTQQFESTVGETYATKTALQSVDDKIDNLEIGGRNLILNTGEAKTSAASASDSSYTTNYTLSDYGHSIMNNTDDEWYCSFDYAVSGNSNSNVNVYFQFRGSATTVDITPKLSGDASGHYGEAFKLSSTHASSTSKNCRFRMQRATDGATITITNLKLEKGNRQTDWSPAPEDLETTVSSIEQRVTNAETSITNNATEIGLRAKSSDVYTKQESDGLISTEVTNRNAAITESANAITLSVSQQYVTNQRFDDLKIGGRNLIPSSVFTNVGIDGSTRELGPVELSVIHSNFNADGKYIWNIFEPETQYTFRVGALATDPSAQASTKAGARFYFRYTDGTTDMMSFSYGVTSVQYQTMTSQAGKTIERFTASYSNSGTTWTFYEMKLEKGNRATDWTPAPEDLDVQFESMRTDIDQNAEAIKLTATKEEVEKTYSTKDEAQMDRSGSGASVAVEGAANASLKGLHILGESVQDGTPSPSAPMPIVSVGGVNLLVNSDTGSGWSYSTFDASTCEYTRSTTATGESFVTAKTMTFEAGQTYTLSCWAKSNGYVKSLDLFKVHSSGGGSHQSRTGISLTTEYQRISWTFVCNATTTETAYIRFDNNGSTTSGTAAILYIKEPQLEVGPNCNPYVPIGSLGMWLRGKNLLSFQSVASYTTDGITRSADAVTQTIMVSGTATKNNVDMDLTLAYPIHVPEGATVTLSLDGTVSSGQFVVFLYDGSYFEYHDLANGPATFTEAGGRTVRLVKLRSGTASGAQNINARIQLELGSEATEYEPYSGSVTPIPLNGHELRSLPDGTQDELTVDVDGHVTMTQRVGSLTLDGSEKWLKTASNMYTSLYWLDNNIRNAVDNNNSGGVSVMTDRFQFMGSYGSNYGRGGVTIGGGGNQITNVAFDNVNNNIATSMAVSEWVSWVSSNHITVVYSLATTQTIDLGTIDMPQVKDGDTVEVIAALTPSIDVTWWASAGQAVADAYASLSSAIEVRAESIVSTVSERYATSQEVQDISSQITQTAQSWTAQFNELTGGADLSMTLAQAFETLGVTSDNLEEIRSFVRITTDSAGDPVLLMGSATSPIMLALSNDSLRFMHGSDPVAYIDVDDTTNEGMLHITRAVVVKELQFGSWKWFERDGVGNLALKWVGEEA